MNISLDLAGYFNVCKNRILRLLSDAKLINFCNQIQISLFINLVKWTGSPKPEKVSHFSQQFSEVVKVFAVSEPNALCIGRSFINQVIIGMVISL